MAVTALDDEVHRVVSTAFDAAFYRAVYDDLVGPGFDPLRHYLAGGWREGRDPAPWFSADAYLAANPDIAASGAEPFYHYLTTGRREGREAPASAHAAAWMPTAVRRGVGWSLDAVMGTEPEPVPEPEPEIDAEPPAPLPEVSPEERELVQPEFDAEYYLAANPDIASAGHDPLDHFLLSGWREGRDPSPAFSLRDYLEIYPDIADAGMNPFVHYLRTGRGEGRMPRAELGFRYDVLKAFRPIVDRVEEAATASAQLELGSQAMLTAALRDSLTGLADLHVTFSHDDYRINTGGVQLCLQREHARVAALGRDHLHLFPAKPWPVMRDRSEPGQLGVVWNDRHVGVFSPQVVARTLRRLTRSVTPGARTFAIHNLLGHSVDETIEIVRGVGLDTGWFWLHDFASLCAGYHLLRNDVQDCAAPPPDSAACGICVYLPYRLRHLAEHERLFASLDLTVVAPSQPTLDLWKASWSYPTKAEIVLPHAGLAPRGTAPVPPADRPFRLAFAGVPFPHKGWPIFAELARRHAKDPRYEFVHLGVHTPPGAPVRFHEVRVTEAQPRLMQQTLEALEVDAVLVWPLCRETFSFTAYEAVAAGCALITGPDSGNVQAFVRDGGHGWVLPDEAALADALESGRLLELSRAARQPQLHELLFSGVTADLMTSGARR
jgi:hypothetical protein